MVIAGEAGAVCNDFFSGDFTRGNPILCATPGIAAELSALTGISLPGAQGG